MGLSAGSVTIGLGADYGNLTRDLYKANATLGRFAKGIPALIKNPLVMSGAALGGVVTGVFKEFQESAKLQSFADSMGTTAGSVAELQRQASRAGVDIESMNQVMVKTATVVSMAAAGMGEGREALKALGLDAKELSLMPLVKQIEAVGNAINETADEGQRIAMAAKLFGEQGAKSWAAISGAASIAASNTGNALDKMQTQAGIAAKSLKKDMTIAYDGIADTLGVVAQSAIIVMNDIKDGAKITADYIADNFRRAFDSGFDSEGAKAALREQEAAAISSANRIQQAFSAARQPIVDAKWKQLASDFDKAKALTEQYDTEANDAKKKMELERLLKAGSISQTVFDRAMAGNAGSAVGSASIINRSLIDVSGYAAQSIQSQQLAVQTQQLNALNKLVANSSAAQTTGRDAVVTVR